MSQGRFPSGYLLAFAVWMAIFAAIYLFIDARLQPTVATASAADAARGEIVIPRSRDGHYYLRGSINGRPLVFLVDTGATMVSVDGRFAEAAGLARGEPVTFATAGGQVEGEVVRGLTVEAGGIRVGPLSVGVGTRLPGGSALLGQNFLRHVDVLQADDRMVLRLKRDRG